MEILIHHQKIHEEVMHPENDVVLDYPMRVEKMVTTNINEESKVNDEYHLPKPRTYKDKLKTI